MKSGATKTGNKVVVSFVLPDNIVQYIDEMAKKEKTYEEILKYYFSGIKIEKTGKH